MRDASESLAGRVEFIEMSRFDLAETDPDDLRKLWRRGGFPRSYLATSEEDSSAWRNGFIRTFLERDLLVQQHGRCIGFEMKFNEAPKITRIMRRTAETPALDHLFVVCPTRRAYPVTEKITVLPAGEVVGLSDRIDAVRK